MEGMAALRSFAAIEASALAGLSMILLFYKLLSGGISTRGLLADKLGRRRVCPERVQLIAATAATAASYAAAVMVEAGKGSGVMPSVAPPILWVAGGGNIIFLAGKLASHFKSGSGHRGGHRHH
jgi:hypothetical protein